MTDSLFRLGDTVRHPALGNGRVDALLYDFRRRQTHAMALFTIGGGLQRRRVAVKDLTAVAPQPIPQPALRVVEGVV